MQTGVKRAQGRDLGAPRDPRGEPGKGVGWGETIPGGHCSSQNEAARNSTLPGELQ